MLEAEMDRGREKRAAYVGAATDLMIAATAMFETITKAETLRMERDAKRDEEDRYLELRMADLETAVGRLERGEVP
jgi:hypothetical protein